MPSLKEIVTSGGRGFTISVFTAGLCFALANYWVSNVEARFEQLIKAQQRDEAFREAGERYTRDRGLKAEADIARVIKEIAKHEAIRCHGVICEEVAVLQARVDALENKTFIAPIR